MSTYGPYGHLLTTALCPGGAAAQPRGSTPRHLPPWLPGSPTLARSLLWGGYEQAETWAAEGLCRLRPTSSRAGFPEGAVLENRQQATGSRRSWWGQGLEAHLAPSGVGTSAPREERLGHHSTEDVYLKETRENKEQRSKSQDTFALSMIPGRCAGCRVTATK